VSIRISEGDFTVLLRVGDLAEVSKRNSAVCFVSTIDVIMSLRSMDTRDSPSRAGMGAMSLQQLISSHKRRESEGGDGTVRGLDPIPNLC
jgi:hypothetical protein